MAGTPWRGRAAATLLVLVMTLSAACVGPERAPAALLEETSTAEPSARAGPAQYSRDTCAIWGQVMDDEALPVGGANVVLIGTGIASSTAQDGNYSLSYVAPGNYTLAVARPGSLVTTTEIGCAPNSLVEVPTLVLHPDVIRRDPYVLQYVVRHGTLGCSASAVGNSVADFCTSSLLVPGANATSNQNYDAPPGNVTGFVLELVWQKNSAAGPEMLQVGFPRAQEFSNTNYTSSGYLTVDGGGTEYAGGRSPLRLAGRVEDPAGPSLYDIDEDGRRMRYRIQVGDTPYFQEPSEYPPLDVSLFTKFDLYLTYFYNAEPMPGAYTHLA